MQITINSRTFEITDELRARIERRVRFALDAFGDHVQTAQVQFDDVNGPRGGVDKRCQISVAIQGAAPVLVRVSAVSVYAALNRATRSAKYRVSENLRQVQRPDTESVRRMGVAA